MKKKTMASEGRPEPLPVSSNGTQSKGVGMSGFVVMFFCCIALVFLAMWLYDKSENTAFHKMQSSFSTFKAENDERFKKLEDNLAGAEGKNELLDLRLTTMTAQLVELETKFEISNKRSINAKTECARLQEHCAKLRESQIQLQDMISKRRPVVTFKGPIPIEVYTNPKSTATGVPVKRGRPSKTKEATVKQ